MRRLEPTSDEIASVDDGASTAEPLRRLAVVDDDPVARHLLRAWGSDLGYRVVEYAGGRDAIEHAADCPVVSLDLELEDMRGLDVLRHLHALDVPPTVIVVTADTKVDTAVAAMRAGAYDYLTKPVDRARFEMVLGRAIERASLLARVRGLTQHATRGLGPIVGESAAMKELERQIRNVLESDIAVCIRGESGSGKELVARAIHENGRRRAGPFVAVNCAAIPQSLQESELFGHERGAFTGALATHRGRFEQASGGTLFLDEIGEMSPMTQASLLRALQERTIRRVGGTTDIPVQLRVVCATHRDLEVEVKAGHFREDLYFRLVVYPIVVPPLRDRRADLPLLVAHMLRKFRDDVGREVARVDADALEALAAYAWPGNVRELENTMHRAMLACSGNEIRLADLPPAIRAGALPSVPAPKRAPAAEPFVGPDGKMPTLREIERRAIAHALGACDGNVNLAAKMLGVGRATLYRRLAELQMTKER